MSTLMQNLHVIGAFNGVLLAVLLIFGTNTSTASRILGMWCLFLGLYFLGPFIYLEQEVNAFSPLLGLHKFLPASFGAFLYLYCRHAIIEHPVKLKDLWHFSPFLLCYLLNIELYFSPAEVKLDALLNGPKNLTPIIIAQVILTLQAFIYLGFSMVMVRRYQNQAEYTLSNYNPEVFSWLWKLLILNLLIWSIKGFSSIAGHNAIYAEISDCLIVLFIYSIAMAQWRNHNLFKIDQLKVKTDERNKDNKTYLTQFIVTKLKDRSMETCSTNENLSTDNTSAENSGALDPSIRSSLLEVVREHMKAHKTYLDNQLTLIRLAEAVNISTHHLSEVLNQHGGKNFYQFVNEYRINYICEQLKVDRDIKILDLALSAGFSSKSTFNAVFKQFMQLTPSQYRKQLAIK